MPAGSVCASQRLLRTATPELGERFCAGCIVTIATIQHIQKFGLFRVKQHGGVCRFCRSDDVH